MPKGKRIIQFDAIGRPASATYTLDTSYQVNYAHNSIGAMDTVTYPTSTSGFRFALKYLYSYGFLQQVKDNAAGTTFWSLSSANDYSSPTSELLGNAVTITSGYTPWTNDLTTRQEGTGGSTTNLQNLAYQWDLNGNLQQRQDLAQINRLPMRACPLRAHCVPASARAPRGSCATADVLAEGQTAGRV